VLLPVLTMLFVIACDYGRIFYYSVILENCARNGAYFASNYSPQIYAYPDVSTAASEDAQVNFNPDPQTTAQYSSSVNGPYTGTTPSSGGYVQVTATWTFNTILTYPGVPSTVSLSRAVRMRIAPDIPTFKDNDG
jgi:hypothetical protein